MKRKLSRVSITLVVSALIGVMMVLGGCGTNAPVSTTTIRLTPSHTPSPKPKATNFPTKAPEPCKPAEPADYAQFAGGALVLISAKYAQVIPTDYRAWKCSGSSAEEQCIFGEWVLKCTNNWLYSPANEKDPNVLVTNSQVGLMWKGIVRWEGCPKGSPNSQATELSATVLQTQPNSTPKPFPTYDHSRYAQPSPTSSH